jgi:cell division protein FtsQ
MSTHPLPTASALPTDVRLMHAGAQALLVCAALAVLASVLMWAARGPWFALHHIRIDGEVSHNTASTIRDQALPLLRGGYFSMNLQQARQAFESVPWVRRAQLQRVWPDRLVVRLEEHHAVAYWERTERAEGEPQLVNRQGEVFEANVGDVEDEPLPVLRGPQGTAAQVWAMWQRLLPEIEPLGSRPVRLALSDGGSWQVRLDHADAVIELGRGEPDEVLQRLRRFVQTVGQVRARYENRPIEYADLRHSESYALRLVGVGTTEPTKPGTPGPRPAKTGTGR